MRLAFIVSTTCLAAVLSSTPVAAETQYDVGLLAGWLKTSPAGTALSFHVGPSYEVTLARQVWRNAAVSVAVEIPFFAQNSISTKTPGALLPREYASLFLTPGVRLHVRPERRVSVYGTFGGGYARYSESKLREDGGPNPQQRDTNAGALQFGAGVDVRGGSWLGLRGEVRDIVTGARQFSIAVPNSTVHNIIMSLGVGIRF